MSIELEVTSAIANEFNLSRNEVEEILQLLVEASGEEAQVNVQSVCKNIESIVNWLKKKGEVENAKSIIAKVKAAYLGDMAEIEKFLYDCADLIADGDLTIEDALVGISDRAEFAKIKVQRRAN